MELPPDDPLEEGASRPVAAPARWWPRLAMATFAAMVSGWAWQQVPADWRAGRPLRASAEAALVVLVFYAWLRSLHQIWRGRRAAAEEQALARRRD
jgi:hypothetical protein